MVQQVLRTTAENELRAQRCSPRQKSENPLGQYWETVSGYGFFLQWVPPEGIYVDEEHLKSLLIDVEGRTPVKKTIPN